MNGVIGCDCSGETPYVEKHHFQYQNNAKSRQILQLFPLILTPTDSQFVTAFTSYENIKRTSYTKIYLRL